MSDEPEIELKILDSYVEDNDRGVCRLDYTAMVNLKVISGDIVEIISKNSIVARVMPLHSTDEKGIVRLDKTSMDNLGVGTGDVVKIRKINAQECKKYHVVALEAIPPIDNRYVSDALDGVVLIPGMEFKIPYFGGRLRFKMIRAEPDGAVIIRQSSVCTILDELEPVELQEFNELIESYRSLQISQLRQGLKDKNTEDIEDALEKIRNLDLVIAGVNQIFSGNRLEAFPPMKEATHQTLKEAIDAWIKKRSLSK